MAVGNAEGGVASSGMGFEPVSVNLNGLSDRCCRFVGIIGDAWNGLSLRAMESESSCMSLGCRFGGGERN